MSQTFVEGFRIPTTKILAGPCVVTQVKTQKKDGYWAVQLGFGTRKAKNTSKPLQGHLKKNRSVSGNGKNYPRYLREVRLDKELEVKVGDLIKASDLFKVGDIISVTGVSKGKGFAGVVKRWHFAGGPKTHGQSDRQRAPGSIGGTTTPGRVYKGKKMAGRMGGDTVTVKNLHIISINPEESELIVLGPVPGRDGSLVIVKKISSGSLADLEREHETAPKVEQIEEVKQVEKETAKQP